MTKTEFFLKISVQYQSDNDKNKEKYQLGDYRLIQYQLRILQANITNEILGVKGITSEFIGDTLRAFISIGVRGWIVTLTFHFSSG